MVRLLKLEMKRSFLFQVCLKHEDNSIDKGFCIKELAEMSDCVDNNDCSEGSASSLNEYILCEKQVAC